MLALASVVPCVVLMEDGRRPQSASRRTAVCHFARLPGRCFVVCRPSSTVPGQLYHCPGLPNATLCRRTERHHTAACIPQPTCCDTAACPGRLLLPGARPVAVSVSLNGGLAGLAISTTSSESQGSPKRRQHQVPHSMANHPGDVTYLGAGLCPNASCSTACPAVTRSIYELIL